MAAEQATGAGTVEKQKRKAQRKLEKQMKLADGSQGQKGRQQQQPPEGLGMPQPDHAPEQLVHPKKKKKKQAGAAAAQLALQEANGASPAGPPAADPEAAAAAPTMEKKMKKKRRKQAAEQEMAQPSGSTVPSHAEPDDGQAAALPQMKKKKAQRQEEPGSALAAELASMAQVGDREAARAGRPIQKAVYAEHPAVSALSDAEVAAWRSERSTVVDGCNLRPVPAFEHAGAFSHPFSCAYALAIPWPSGHA